MSQHNGTSERELAEKIIYLHDVLGLGFRKVAKELVKQGYKVNKDNCNQIYNKYKACTDTGTKGDKELAKLRAAETRARQQLMFRKEKEEVRNRLTTLFAEKQTVTYQQRKNLFTDWKRLLEFSGRVMRTADATLWDRFVEHCWERNIDLGNAVATALGKQADYEELTDENGRQRFDLYLRDRLRAALDRWTDYDEEESEYREETEQTTEGSESEAWIEIDMPDDWIQIEIPDGAFPQPDETEYEIVEIPIDNDLQSAPPGFQSSFCWIPLFDDEEENEFSFYY